MHRNIARPRRAPRSDRRLGLLRGIRLPLPQEEIGTGQESYIDNRSDVQDGKYKK
ncbi:hypothetical protein GCM10007285_30020 [Stappia taiwanensis]|nr:hypothetical protein GCM10007285_30020 [Stappia taiwanensis]